MDTEKFYDTRHLAIEAKRQRDADWVTPHGMLPTVFTENEYGVAYYLNNPLTNQDDWWVQGGVSNQSDNVFLSAHLVERIRLEQRDTVKGQYMYKTAPVYLSEYVLEDYPHGVWLSDINGGYDTLASLEAVAGDYLNYLVQQGTVTPDQAHLDRQAFIDLAVDQTLGIVDWQDASGYMTTEWLSGGEEEYMKETMGWQPTTDDYEVFSADVIRQWLLDNHVKFNRQASVSYSPETESIAIDDWETKTAYNHHTNWTLIVNGMSVLIGMPFNPMTDWDNDEFILTIRDDYFTGHGLFVPVNQLDEIQESQQSDDPSITI